MLPASTHVGRVSLQIADLDRSRQFYEEIIGFRVIELGEAHSHRVARLGVQGTTDWLLELHEKPGVRRVPPRGRIGLYHFAVLLPARADLGRFIVHATASAVRLASADHLVSEALYLTDPDGLQIEVYCDQPREAWQWRNGELVMATRPLDFDPIVASVGNTTWTGLPAGTVVGHVHLYVEDLDAARAFYVAALGFAPTLTGFPGALFVSAGGYHHHLGLNTWAAGSPVATDDDAKLRFWEVAVPDAEAAAAAVERLTRAGYGVDVEGDAPEALDPWGIGVRLVSAP